MQRGDFQFTTCSKIIICLILQQVLINKFGLVVVLRVYPTDEPVFLFLFENNGYVTLKS